MILTPPVFYFDPINGNDAARTAMTGVTLADNGSGLFRCTKSAHGLVTGAVVDISGSSGVAGAWAVTRISDSTFDLVGSTYAAGKTVTSITPRGGSSWADAWLSWKSGLTAARLAQGGTNRIAKSPAPVSIGNATWTDKSKTVTLAAAQTLMVDNCTATWTAAAGTIGQTTDTKFGSYAQKITAPASGNAANTLYAYRTISSGGINLSSWQRLSLWLKNSAAVAGSQWVLCLCSETNGTGIVDGFPLPPIPSTGFWVPLAIAKSGGGNLGTAIKSIALYSATAAPAASSNLILSDIIACTTSGLSLTSLIGKNSLDQGGVHGWYGIQSINGTAVLLDNDVNCIAGSGRGYSGTTESAATYFREGLKSALRSSYDSTDMQVNGNSTVTLPLTLSGGWNPAAETPTQDGETIFDGQSGCAYGLMLTGMNFFTADHLSFVRYYIGLYLSGSNLLTIGNMLVCGNCTGYGLSVSSCGGVTLSGLGCINNNGTYGAVFSSCSKLRSGAILEVSGNQTYGLYFSYDCYSSIAEVGKINNNGTYGIFSYFCIGTRLRKSALKDNGSYGIMSQGGDFCAEDALTTQQNTAAGAYNNQRILLHNLNRVAVNHQIVTDGGLIQSDNTSRHTASGLCWRLQVTNSFRDVTYPLDLTVAKIWCQASVAVTVKAWIKKSSATAIAAALVCRGGQIAGVGANVIATKANDTSYEQLSISFTPTAAGLVTIEVWAWYISGTVGSCVYVDDLELPAGVATQSLDFADSAQPWAQNAPAATGGGGGTRAWAHVGI